MKARVTQNRHECDTYIPKIDLHLCSCSDHNLTHKQIDTGLLLFSNNTKIWQ